MKGRIQDADWRYRTAKKYVDFLLRSSYRRIEYSGLEKIPRDGAVIYSPNHTNALMDALVILAMESRPVVYVARADIFRRPRTARILNFLKIMPIMRRRDGFDEVRKNDGTIRNAADVLHSGVPFCILPEGTHRTQHSLLPLGKGIFRIAIEARECIPADVPLYIVPVGIEYGNYFRFRSTVFTQIGEPINVGDFISAYPDKTVPEMVNGMRSLLTGRMRSVILYIRDDEWYDAVYELCSIMVRQFLMRIPMSEGSIMKRRLKANRAIVSKVEEFRSADEAAAISLFELADEIRRERLASNISLSSVSSRVPVLTLVWRASVIIVTLPYTVPAGIAVLPVAGVARWLHKKMPDDAFYNSIRYVSLLFFWPICLLVYAVIAFICLPWQLACIVTLLLMPAYNYCHDALRYIRILLSDIRLLRNRSLKNKIRTCRAQFDALAGNTSKRS